MYLDAKYSNKRKFSTSYNSILSSFFLRSCEQIFDRRKSIAKVSFRKIFFYIDYTEATAIFSYHLSHSNFHVSLDFWELIDCSDILR